MSVASADHTQIVFFVGQVEKQDASEHNTKQEAEAEASRMDVKQEVKQPASLLVACTWL